MDEELMCESLMKWVNTFEGIKAPHRTINELTDGVALCQCLAEIAPDWFDDEWISKIRQDTGDNRRLKVNNLKKLLKGVIDYYTEVLTMDITGFSMPDVNAIVENQNISELGRLLQLVLGCAVNCEDKQEYIQVIMSMEESVQHVVMMAIQELLTIKDGGVSGRDPEMYKELEMERLREKLNHQDSGERDDEISFSNQKLQQLHHQVERLKEDNFTIETSRDEYKIKCDQMDREVLHLNERIEQLQSLAEESQMLKDEMDVLRHSQEKVIKYESTIELYKKKLEELSDMRKQMKALEEKNVTYMKETMNLQEDLRKANALKTQVDTYKKQVHQLQIQVSDLQRRADKAEFEARKSKEKLTNLDGENERLRQERMKLREENEELQLAQVAGSPMRQLTPGTPPSDDFDIGSALSPEMKERILRLEHENKKLKEQKLGEQEDQNQLLQSLLSDANERKDQLEKENRELNQKLMEAESELDDFRSQKSADQMEKGSELDKKYTDHFLEPKVNSSAEKVTELEELLNKKDHEMKVMEDRYKKYLEKAKSVIKTLDPRQSQASQPEVQLLKSQVQEKDKIIEHLERDHEKMKITREREEKLIVSAWYEMGMQLNRKAAEERLSGNSGGMSFLARQRQASSRRSTPNRTQQTSAVSSRDT
ncbi:Protein Hook-like protein [Acropora cervicornis]|uniref:Protein Hook-like protein n=1 Tax=Acropora cervicornis TaxID=6130 RepID=A0AAD9QYN3_ACRCE|nr:Protein Hook-like protein [Acropora cervicornis]